jgi:hypothetical protein
MLLHQRAFGVAPANRKTGSRKRKKPLQVSDLQRLLLLLAEWTGLEPATPGVTGRYSNQLNYHSYGLPHRCASAIDLASPRGFEPL